MAENIATLTSSSTDPHSNNDSASKPTTKWTGGVHLILQCTLSYAWRLQSDFMSLHKWVPTIRDNRLVDGEPNRLGCMRYCKGSGTTWVHERLLELDDESHFMSYRMEENRFVYPEGFHGYFAKVQLGEAGEGQTWVNWTYEVDPVESQTRENVTKFMSEFYTQNLKYLETAANKLAAAAAAAGTPETSETPALNGVVKPEQEPSVQGV